MKKKKLNVNLLYLIMHMKQMMTLTLKLKQSIIPTCPLMNFMTFQKVFFKDILDKYVVDISLADEEIKQT